MAPYELFLSELFIKTPLDPGSIGFNTILLKTRSILIRNGTERNGGLYINEVFLYTHKILFSRVMLNLPAGVRRMLLNLDVLFVIHIYLARMLVYILLKCIYYV